MNFVIFNKSNIMANAVFSYIPKQFTNKPQYSIITYQNRTLTTTTTSFIETNTQTVLNSKHEKLIDLCIENDKIDFNFDCFLFKLTTDYKFALLFLLFVFVIFLDIFLNIIVLISILKTKKLKRVDLCFLSNAIADLLMGLFIMPCTTILILFNHFPLGKYVCFLWNCLDFTGGTVSMLHIMFISYDRYLSVSKPLQYTQKSTNNDACFSITRMPTSSVLVLIWLVSICAWVPVVFYLKTQENTTIDVDRLKLSNNFTNYNSNIEFFDKISRQNLLVKENTSTSDQITNKINSIECTLDTNPFIIVPHSIFVYFIPMILIILFYSRTIIIVQRKIRRKRRQSVVSSTKSLNKSSSNNDDTDTDEDLNLFNKLKNSFRERFSLTKCSQASSSSSPQVRQQNSQKQDTIIDLNSTTILKKLFSKFNFKTSLNNANSILNNSVNNLDSSTNTNTITNNTDFTSSSVVRRSALEINNILTKLQENEVNFNLYVENPNDNDGNNEQANTIESPQKGLNSENEIDNSSIHSSIISPNLSETKLPKNNNENESFSSVSTTNQRLRMQFFMKRPSIETSSTDIELNKFKTVSSIPPAPPSTPTALHSATIVATTTTTTLTTKTILNKTTPNTLIVPRKNIISFNDEVVSCFEDPKIPQKTTITDINNNNLLPIIKRRKSCLGPTDININFTPNEKKSIKLTASELKRNLSLFNNFQPNSCLNTIIASNTNSNSSSDATGQNSPLLQKQYYISPSSISIYNQNTHAPSTTSMVTQASSNISGNTKREKYVTYKLGIIMVAFIFCWLPFALFWSIDSFCKGCINAQLYLFTFWLAYLNSIFTPLILLYTNTKYRRNIFFLQRFFALPCKFCSSKNSTETYTNGQLLDPNRQLNKSLYHNRTGVNASNYHLINRDKSINLDGASGVYGIHSAAGK